MFFSSFFKISTIALAGNVAAFPLSLIERGQNVIIGYHATTAVNLPKFSL